MIYKFTQLYYRTTQPYKIIKTLKLANLNLTKLQNLNQNNGKMPLPTIKHNTLFAVISENAFGL